jgi:2-polyprenyl-3-methyl-5-hydroxy-6-metoxy-1,4-benzoquinol methylase
MKKYWERFYQQGHTLEPSEFAKEYTKMFYKDLNIIDVLAGNGRDTLYLQKKGFSVKGIDFAFEGNGVEKMSLRELFKNECHWDVVYSRFGIHCLKNRDIKKLIRWTKEYIALEFRTKGDIPKLYHHKRHFINPDEIVKYLLSSGFTKIYIKYGYNMATFKDENPLICRIYANK